MYVVKITTGKQLLDVKHYNYFQNVVSDIGSGEIFDNISDDFFDNLGNPQIFTGSINTKNNVDIADDFEFRYQNGITVYVGELFPRDFVDNK